MRQAWFTVALVACLTCPANAQNSAALTARYNELAAGAEQAEAADQWTRLDSLVREMARIGRALGEPRMEFVGLIRVYTANAMLQTEASKTAAAFAIDSAIVALERIRQRATTPAERLQLFDDASLVLEFWVQSIARSVDGIGVERAGFFATLAAADRGRARNLLDVIGGEIAAPASPAELVAVGQRLHGVAATTNASVVSYLVTDLRVMVWYSGPDSSMQISITEIEESAFADLVRNARAELGVDDAAAEGARAVAEALGDTRGVRGTAPRARGDTTAGRRLTEILLPDNILLAIGSARRRDVVIVPHRAVALVPFAALPTANGSAIGELLAFRYAPSIAVLEGIEARTTTSVFDSVATGMVVGDPAMPTVRESGRPIALAPLPGARREAGLVASEFGLRPIVGAEATESLVRERMSTSTILHLATHGYAYGTPDREGESFVALAPDASNDGLLTVAELEALPGRMNADLVVLSACQTGLGSARQSEGTIGLPRALIAAGARSVLASLWSVSDEATELLMQRFYHWWLEGAGQMPKGRALWLAQTDVRNDPRFAHPRYWAAFQLVGGN
jgi:hypothetical protein